MDKVQNRLKVVLVENGVKNKDLAEGIDRDLATISRWCTNKAQPSLETLFEIAQFLDVSIRVLLVDNKK